MSAYKGKSVKKKSSLRQEKKNLQRMLRDENNPLKALMGIGKQTVIDEDTGEEVLR